MGCGADTEANVLLTSLTAGISIDIPVLDLDNIVVPEGSDLSTLVTKLTNEDLTSRTVGGTGTFDALMESVKTHLQQEYDAGRLVGADYTRAYIELTSAVMGNATQFLLGRDRVFWEGQTAQLAALTAAVQLQMAKIQAAQALFEANTVKVNYAKTKIQLAGEDMQYCSLKFNYEQILPEQLAGMKEQKEAARAQTLDTRTDGSMVTGTIGKQRDLYNQQIVSYKRDAETKVAKILSDAWITQKTVDEGLLAPTIFQNASINEAIAGLILNVELPVISNPEPDPAP